MISIKKLIEAKDVDSVFQQVPFYNQDDNWDHLSLLPGNKWKWYEEKNTKDEQIIANYLEDWIDNSTLDAANALKSYESVLKQAKQKFPNIFKPSGKTAYRGTLYNNDKIFNWFKKNQKNKTLITKNISGETWYTCDSKFLFKANKPIQSWTPDFDVALSFARLDNYNESLSPIILSTVIDDDFIFNPLFMDAIYQYVHDSGTYENEIISFKKDRKVNVFINTFTIKEIINNRQK